MQAKRFETLDGWRGIAALAIAFYHAPFAHPLRDLSGWKNWELFVDLFFVLSGFVICHAWGSRLKDSGGAKDFTLRRFWRVWPLHFAVLMAFVLIEVAKAGAGLVLANLPLDDAPFTGGRSWSALVSNIVMIQSLNLHGTTTWNGPAWSISVEFWTYLIFAATMLAFGARSTRAFLVLALAGAAGIAAFSPIWLFTTHDFGLFRAMFGFFLGAVAYRLLNSGRFEIAGGTIAEIVTVLAMIAFLASTGPNRTSMLAPPVFAVLILVFARGRGHVTAALESRPVQALGLWSYSIYLVHALIYYVLRLALVFVEKVMKLPLTASGSGNERVFTLGNGILDIGAIIALLALTIWLSGKTYRLIEKPFMAGKTEPGREDAALRNAFA